MFFSTRQWTLFVMALLCSTIKGDDQAVVVDESTNPIELARQICINSRDTCLNLVFPLIELEKSSLFNIELNNWQYNEACGCPLPPQTKLSHLQYFHIPKSGTSINWFLRDYFDNCNSVNMGIVSLSEDPCPLWLETVNKHLPPTPSLSPLTTLYHVLYYFPLLS